MDGVVRLILFLTLIVTEVSEVHVVGWTVVAVMMWTVVAVMMWTVVNVMIWIVMAVVVVVAVLAVLAKEGIYHVRRWTTTEVHHVRGMRPTMHEVRSKVMVLWIGVILCHATFVMKVTLHRLVHHASEHRSNFAHIEPSTVAAVDLNLLPSVALCNLLCEMMSFTIFDFFDEAFTA